MSMKILEAKAELVQDKSYPGLFDCKLTHKIKETSAVFHYTGPKFSPQMWSEILAFFKWSYAKTHGESQVRLFVHPTEGWRAWAFPQEASSGLATTELPDNPETKAQRAQFGDDWIPYGTVHHHCSISAFQSGTDTHNEHDQEGIHITVGDIDKDFHSLHCRFYYQGCKFQPDLEDFWDAGDEARAKAKELAEYFSITVDLNQQAEIQMRRTCPKDAPFPEQWMANLIEKKWPVTTVGDVRGEFWGRGNTGYCVEDPGFKGYPTRAIKALRKSFRKAYKDDIKTAGGLTLELRESIDDKIASLLEHIVDDKEIGLVLELAERHQTTVDDIARKFQEIAISESRLEPPVDQKEIEEELKAEQDALLNAGGKGGITGVGDGNDYGGYGNGYGCT